MRRSPARRPAVVAAGVVRDATGTLTGRDQQSGGDAEPPRSTRPSRRGGCPRVRQLSRLAAVVGCGRGGRSRSRPSVQSPVPKNLGGNHAPVLVETAGAVVLLNISQICAGAAGAAAIDVQTLVTVLSPQLEVAATHINHAPVLVETAGAVVLLNISQICAGAAGDASIDSQHVALPICQRPVPKNLGGNHAPVLVETAGAVVLLNISQICAGAAGAA